MPADPLAPASPVESAPLIDVLRQYKSLESELVAAMARVCESGRFVLGPDCELLERNLAAYCGAEHAVACASGSDALLLAMMACGVGPGDDVLLPSFTFFATASAVARLGARPVFVDIEPAGFNLDPRRLEQAVTPATKAIVPVHLYGQCAEMDAIASIAAGRRIPIIEDAAQAIGAEYRGVRSGALADAACFSFYPTKNLGGFGDGGLLTARDSQFAETLKLLRVHGMQTRYYHKLLGLNSRLDTLQAAILNVKLAHLDSWTESRRAIANRYAEGFAARGLDRVLGLPGELPNRRHVWNQYVVRVPDGKRDSLREHLTARRVGCEVYYPVPLHRQECFAGLKVDPDSLPETNRACREVLALPMFPELSIEEQSYAIRQVASFFEGAGRRSIESRQPERRNQAA